MLLMLRKIFGSPQSVVKKEIQTVSKLYYNWEKID